MTSDLKTSMDVENRQLVGSHWGQYNIILLLFGLVLPVDLDFGSLPSEAVST